VKELTMRVLAVTNLFPSTREPTRGVFNGYRLGALANYSETQVIAPVPWWQRAAGDWFQTPFEAQGALTATFPTYWSIPRCTPIHASGMRASLSQHVRALRKTFAFDVILAAWAYPDAVAAAHLAHVAGCPLVTMTLGSDINDLAVRPALRKQILWGLRRSHHIVTVSSALRDKIIGFGISPDRITVQRNSVDGAAFTIRDIGQVRIQLGLSPERKMICYVGNLKPEKGVDVLVSAMDHLVHRLACDVDLMIVGSGSEEEMLRARIRQLSLDKHIYFMGRRSHTEIPLWISAADVFCLPSRREGCPNVVLEALASGRPVVASAVGGVPELINPNTGILVPSDDPVAMAQGLRTALERDWNPTDLRNSVESLSWDHCGRSLRDVLEAAVASYHN